VIAALLAAAPALPLHEAGKYVAGAFVAFVAIILVYVAIMAVKLQRMGKELNELSAAMGITNLECLDEYVRINKRNLAAYREGLSDLPGVHCLEYSASERNNHQYVVLEIEETTAGLTRDELHAVLHAEKILARRYFFPGCHQMEPYRTECPGVAADLPETVLLCKKVLVMPTGTAVSEAEISVISGIIRTALEHADEVRAALAETPLPGS